MKKNIIFISFLLVIVSAYANTAADIMLTHAIQDDNLREAKYWLEHGADANYITDDGHTLLEVAMDIDFDRHHSFNKFDDSVPLTELLLQNGANPNSKVSLLPLIYAIRLVGDYRLCNVLLKYGANPRMREPSKEINKNAINYARHLGYTRLANLLANPKSYSHEYTVFELNYLIKISFNNQKYDETIKYCNQFYKQLPTELSTNYHGWLTKGHIQFYQVSALFQKSLNFLNDNNYAESERLLLEAIAIDKERKRNGDSQDLGVNLEQNLLMVRNEMAQTPSFVLDKLDFLLQQGRKDTTTIYCLIAAANYLSSISDQEGRYYCLAKAFEWTKEDPHLRKQLSKDTYWSLLSNCTMLYYKNAPRPIMSEDDISDATIYINKTFGAQSIQALQFNLAKTTYYTYRSELDKAINMCNATIATMEKNIDAHREDEHDNEIKELYVLAHIQLSGLYEDKYNHGKFYNLSLLDEDTVNTPAPEELLAYNTLKKILDDSRLNKNLNIVCYTSFFYQCWKLNKLDEIWKYVPTYYSLNHQHIDNALSTLSEEDALYWWGESRPFYYDFDIMIATNKYSYPSYIPGEIYNNELFKKDLLLRTNKRIQQYLAESKDPTIIHLYESMIQQKSILMQMQSTKRVEDHAIDSLKQSIASTERLLASESNVYAQRMKEKEISWKDIKSKLRPNEVAIEFINNGGVDQYWALIIRKEYDSPRIVYLQDFINYSQEDKEYWQQMYERELEFFHNLAKHPHTNHIPDSLMPIEPHYLQFTGHAGEVYEYGGNGSELYKALWKPLTQYVNEGDVVYFSPSGVLLQLAVESLPVDERSILSDHYKLVRLSSTREIVLSRTCNQNKDAILYGNIQYDADDMELLLAESERYQNISRGMSAQANDGTDRGSRDSLPGSEIEVNTISSLLSKYRVKSSILDSYHANEESFKSLSGKAPQILHIATHGFYWDNDHAITEPFITHATTQGTTMVDPLLRCGLLFAGANIAYSGRGSSLPKGIEDGILTAKEISLMDLSNTQLLVLSACETGLGELTDAGVFGLQRAFKQAGVGSIIMSLWKVNDNATQMMMSKFYEFWLSGQDMRTAFYNAQKYIRYIKPNEPYYWAGFIMLD